MHLFFQQLHALMQQQVHLAARRAPARPDDLRRGRLHRVDEHDQAGRDPPRGGPRDRDGPPVPQPARSAGPNRPRSPRRSARASPTSCSPAACSGSATPKTPRQQTRIAMSVYQTMIRADLDSRELMGITPEQSLYLPVWHCLASLIAAGARAARFFGQTYPFEKLRGGPWAEHHMRLLEEAVGPYPEQLPKTYKRTGSSDRRRGDDADRQLTHRPKRGCAPESSPASSSDQRPATKSRPIPEPSPRRARAHPRRPIKGARPRDCAITGAHGAAASRRQVRPLIREAGEVPEVQRSPLRDDRRLHTRPHAGPRRAARRPPRACANSPPTSTPCSASSSAEQRRPDRAAATPVRPRTTRSSRCWTAAGSCCPGCSGVRSCPAPRSARCAAG